MTPEDGGDELEVDRADQHKHMDYIQAVIARLGNNSFVMKGWSLTLSSALLGFAVTRGDAALALVAAGVAIAFWVLDTYFLRQERAFRAMFAEVAAKRVAAFLMNPAPYAKVQSWFRVGRSVSLSAFYGLIVLVCIVMFVTLLAGSSIEKTEPTPTAPPTPAANTKETASVEHLSGGSGSGFFRSGDAQ